MTPLLIASAVLPIGETLQQHTPCGAVQYFESLLIRAIQSMGLQSRVTLGAYLLAIEQVVLWLLAGGGNQPQLVCDGECLLQLLGSPLGSSPAPPTALLNSSLLGLSSER